MKNLIKELNNINFTQAINNTNKQDKKRYFILALWEIILMLFVVYIQNFLRHKNLILSNTNGFLLGTLPSLFGAAGFVAITFVFHRILKIYYGKYNIWKSLLFSNLFTFLGFTLWEIIRIALYPFDLYDIYMTFVGCIVSTILILVLFYKDSKTYKSKIKQSSI